MSAGGKALAESLGQFGTGIKELGETLYNVEADNLYRVGTLDILDKISQFNQSIETDPDHGTPGQNDGYMKKWNDYELQLRKELGGIKNTLARKNLESFLGQAAIKQRDAVAAKQLAGWRTTQKSYLVKELDATKSDMTLTTEQKLAAVSDALRSYKEKNIIDQADEYELTKVYTQDIIKDDYVKGAIAAYLNNGLAGYKEYVKLQSPISHMVGGVAYAIDSGTIQTAHTVVNVLMQPDSESALKAYNDAKTQLSAFKEEIATGEDVRSGTFEMNFAAFMSDLKSKKDLLGSSYDNIIDEADSVYLTYRKNLSTKNRGEYEQKILTAIDTGDPEQVKNSVSDEEIWKNCTVDDASYLVKLKLSGKKEATTEQQSKGTANLAELYSVNEKLKRGEALQDGETPLSRETLKSLLNNNKISSSDYSKYLQQLDADDAENASMKSYWKYRDAIDNGTFDLARMQNDKTITFSMQLNLADLYAKKTSNTELARVQRLALNLRRLIQGEKLGDNDEILTYAALDPSSPSYIKDADARAVAYTSLNAAVDFYRQRGKSEEYLRVVSDIVNGKISDGKKILTDPTITDPGNRVELYSFFVNYTRQELTWGREDENWEYTKGERTKEQVQQHNAFLVQRKFQDAYDTCIGKKTGHEAVSWDDFRTYVNGFDENSLDAGVAKTYLDLANKYEAGQIGGDLAFRIRKIGNAWVDKGAYDQNEYNALMQEIRGAWLPDKESFLELLDRYKENAIAAGRQNAAENRAITSFEQEQAYRKKIEGEQAVVDRIMETFKAKLHSDTGITDDEMEALREDMATNAPNLYDKNWHLIEAMRAGQNNIQFWRNYNIAMEAFREHVNAKTIEGYQLTGEELTHDMINQLFPSEREDDVKAKEYWGTQLDKFDASQAAIQIEVDKEIDLLSRARSNSWVKLLGVGQFDDSVGFLTNDLIESAKHLTGAQRAAFREDLDAINRTIAAKKTADENSKAGIAPSQDQIQRGKLAAQFLKSMANVYEGARKSYASLPTLTYVDRNGKPQTIEYSLDGYMAYLAAHADDLAAAGLLDEATAGIEKMTSKVTDPVWEPVKDALKAIGKAATPEVQKWVDLEIQNTKPTPEAATKLAAAVKKKGIDIKLDSIFKVYTGAYDVSEKYLEAVNKGDLDIYMVSQNGRVFASNPDFQEKIDGFAARTLDAINSTLPRGSSLTEGQNCIREDYESGMVMYRITNTGILSLFGVNGGTNAKRAVAYMGFLGKDAVPMVEVAMKNGARVIKAWYQEESWSKGEWVDVQPYKDSDGIIRMAKVPKPGEKNPTVSVSNMPSYNSIFSGFGMP